MSNENRVSLRALLAQQKLSHLIDPADELPIGTPIFILLRVSFRTQNHKGQFLRQKKRMERLCDERGLIVVGCASVVHSAQDPSFLIPIADEAREKKASHILAESADRFVRPESFHSIENPKATARELDVRYAQTFTEGLKWATVIHPDASFEEIRAMQTKRGRDIAERKRTWREQVKIRKQLRNSIRGRILELLTQGASTRQAAKQVSEEMGMKVSHMLASRLLRQHKRV